MLYNTGNIAINGNNATGNGTNWTAPASQIRAGQTILVLSNPDQMFQIITVNSATSPHCYLPRRLALMIQKYGCPRLHGQPFSRWTGTKHFAADQRIRWEYWCVEEFYRATANQNVTVTINGVSVTIPAIGKLLQKGRMGHSRLTKVVLAQRPKKTLAQTPSVWNSAELRWNCCRERHASRGFRFRLSSAKQAKWCKCIVYQWCRW